MILNPDCIVCSINGTLNLFKKGLLDSKHQEEILRRILEYYSKVDYNQLTISAGKQVKKIIEEISGVFDPYKPLKDEYNKSLVCPISLYTLLWSAVTLSFFVSIVKFSK